MINKEVEKEASKSDMKTYFFSVMLGKAVLKELIKDDIIWAVGAGVFVALYLSFHMRSFFLAFFAIVIIIFSFAIT